ncbi:MAG: S1 RNA-binding domain-containing protein [Oscillospiraceae bacterium]|jgi:S1 RNA binding domain protein|nr:S1 RNA-binding domain-containing protein [Oscillospiraceae bacterium]
MDFEVGAIITGKVTGITKFGAFVTIAPGKSGLVHISEIAGTYVSDVKDHLAEGQEVTVKIIGMDQSGRMNLSIKAASATTADEPHRRAQPRMRPPEEAAEPSFEDKLKRFMQDSDSKISGLKQYPDKKGTRRRGR